MPCHACLLGTKDKVEKYLNAYYFSIMDNIKGDYLRVVRFQIFLLSSLCPSILLKLYNKHIPS